MKKSKQNIEKQDLSEKLLQLLIDLYWLFIRHPIQTSDNSKLFKMFESLLTDNNPKNIDVCDESLKLIINYLQKIDKTLDTNSENYTSLKQECDRITDLCKNILNYRKSCYGVLIENKL